MTYLRRWLLMMYLLLVVVAVIAIIVFAGCVGLNVPGLLRSLPQPEPWLCCISDSLGPFPHFGCRRRRRRRGWLLWFVVVCLC